MTGDRYLRHALAEGLDQSALQAARIAVIGAGAIGNEVVKNLALLGVGTIDVFDFDRVELHNLTRSIFLREADVGRPKASAVASRAAEVDPNVRVRAIEGDVWRTLPLGRLEGYSSAIACVDNFEARMRLSQLCLLAGVDLVNAAIDARYVSVESFPLSAESLPACYECHLPDSAYERVAARYSCGWLPRLLHAERKIATTAITASVAGALAVQAALRIGESSGTSRRVLLDTRTGNSTVTALGRRVGCAGCSEFTHRPHRVPAGGDWRRTLAAAAPRASAVRLSDPIIFGYVCATCGETPEVADYVGRRAADFDDRIARCARCGEHAVRVDIRAEATLEALVERFAGSAIPAKFFLVDNDGEVICIDLEEEPE